jgi:hypothetical protein
LSEELRWKTMRVVLRRRGIGQPGGERFRGEVEHDIAQPVGANPFESLPHREVLFGGQRPTEPAPSLKPSTDISALKSPILYNQSTFPSLWTRGLNAVDLGSNAR